MRVKSTWPVRNKRPITTTSSGARVQTTSPLLTGATWLICTPTLPAGFNPLKHATSTLSASMGKSFVLSCSGFTPTCTFAICDKAEIPALKSFSCPATTNEKSAAKGMEENALTKMSRGATSGEGTTS